MPFFQIENLRDVQLWQRVTTYCRIINKQVFTSCIIFLHTCIQMLTNLHNSILPCLHALILVCLKTCMTVCLHGGVLARMYTCILVGPNPGWTLRHTCIPACYLNTLSYIFLHTFFYTYLTYLLTQLHTFCS